MQELIKASVVLGCSARFLTVPFAFLRAAIPSLPTAAAVLVRPIVRTLSQPT